MLLGVVDMQQVDTVYEFVISFQEFCEAPYSPKGSLGCPDRTVGHTGH